MVHINKSALLLIAAIIPRTSTERMGVSSIAWRRLPRFCGHMNAAFAHSGKRQFSKVYGSQQMHNNYRDLDFLQQYRCRSTKLFVTNDPAESEETDGNTINIPQIKKEITRLSLRTIKKIGKVSVRIQAAEDQLAKARAAMEERQDVDDELMTQLEQAPSDATMSGHQKELADLQFRLQQLNWLEEQFNNSPLKKKGSLTSEELLKLTDAGEQILQYIEEINENEAVKNKRIEEDLKNKRSKKEKSQRQQQEGGRLPYRRYYTESGIEIKVGKQATDNDVLSLSPEYRSGSHWWYHASGCPGSHVVLCTDDASPSEADVKDAASLAALKSKCIGQSVIKVSMTRARNVSKPTGAKPGLVQLNGEVKTITLRKDEVEARCARLEKTVLVN